MRNRASILPFSLPSLAVVALATTLLLPALGCRHFADYDYAEPRKDSAASRDGLLSPDGKVPETNETSSDAPADQGLDVAADDGTGADLLADTRREAPLADSRQVDVLPDTPAPDTKACPCSDGGPSCTLVLSPTADGDGTIVHRKTTINIVGTVKENSFVYHTEELNIDGQTTYSMGTKTITESRALLLFDLPLNAQVRRASLRLCTKSFSTGTGGTVNAFLYQITSPINPIPKDKETVSQQSFDPKLKTKIGSLIPKVKNETLKVDISPSASFSGLIEFMIIRDAGSQRYYSSSTTTTTNPGPCSNNGAPTLSIEYCIP